jgi:hypothetical protein
VVFGYWIAVLKIPQSHFFNDSCTLRDCPTSRFLGSCARGSAEVALCPLFYCTHRRRRSIECTTTIVKIDMFRGKIIVVTITRVTLLEVYSLQCFHHDSIHSTMMILVLWFLDANVRVGTGALWLHFISLGVE